MRTPNPPRLASVLLHRLASGPKRESLMGDLAERWQHGHSATWYWRQVVTAIAAGAVHDVGSHKLLAVRAVIVGVACQFLLSVPVLVLVMNLMSALTNGGLYLGELWLTLPYKWSFYFPFVVNPLVIGLAATATGWVIARLHRPYGMPTVFAYLAFLLVVEGIEGAWLLVRLPHPTPSHVASALITTTLSFTVWPVATFVGGLWAARVDVPDGGEDPRTTDLRAVPD